MEIRRCTIDDVNDIYRLICQLEEAKMSYTKFEIAYKNKLSDEKNYYLVVLIDEKIVGFISINIDYQLHHENKVATIEELITDSEYRGQGLGKALVVYAKALAIDNYCDVIELTSNFTRTNAHQFYQNNGFDKSSYKFKLDLTEEI